MKFKFSDIARKTGNTVASQGAFIFALVLTLLWAVTGPLFHFNDAWQLVINTFTNVVTFLMVFLIQHMQNRDAIAMHKKLDELLRSVSTARNELIDLENMSDEDLEAFQLEFHSLHKQVRNRLRARVKLSPNAPLVPEPSNGSVSNNNF